MIPLSAFPAINAGLNATCATLLVVGLACVRRRRIAAHRACMFAACVVAALFFASYLWYHAHHGSEPYRGRGWVRPVYFSILISHTVLAAAVPVLAAVTVARALRGRLEAHKRIARWTFPIWLYVSVTGIVVYAMLYPFNPAGRPGPPPPASEAPR